MHVAATFDYVPSQMSFENKLLAPYPPVRPSFCLHGTARLLPVLFS